MTRLLLASTAVAALLVTGALAQDASSSSMMDTSMSSSMMDSSMMSAPADTSAMSSSMMDSSTMSSQMSDASAMDSSMMDSSSMMAPTPGTGVDISTGYTRVDTDRLASKIIGSPVYDGTAADANNLGNINDIVLDGNGNVAAVVLGVGGFLGIGEKQVAVSYSALKWTVAADNTERFVLETTKDQLTAAPDFQTVDDKPTDASAMTDASMSSSSAM